MASESKPPEKTPVLQPRRARILLAVSFAAPVLLLALIAQFVLSEYRIFFISAQLTAYALVVALVLELGVLIAAKAVWERVNGDGRRLVNWAVAIAVATLLVCSCLFAILWTMGRIFAGLVF